MDRQYEENTKSLFGPSVSLLELILLALLLLITSLCWIKFSSGNPQLTTSHLTTIQSYNRFKVTYDPTLNYNCYSTPASLNCILGTWQLPCIYHQLQQPAVTCLWLFCYFTSKNIHWIIWIQIYDHVIRLTTEVIHLIRTIVKSSPVIW